MLFTKMNSDDCGLTISRDDENVVQWCKPFEPVNQMIVDFDHDNKVGLLNDGACLSYVEKFSKSRGMDYNFVFCNSLLVFVSNGFQCRSDVLRLSATVWPWYDIPPFFINSLQITFRQIVYEGIRCGKIHPNYNLTINCGDFGSICEIEFKRSSFWLPFIYEYNEYSHKDPWFEPPYLQGQPFQPFDVSRVIDTGDKQIQVCNDSYRVET